MYRVFEEEVVVEPGQSYYAYGIEASNGPWRIGQISVVREQVEQLAQKMNANEVSPIHMEDVTDDWLAEQ